MAERAPVISGKQLIRFMETLGYCINRQRGSHVRLEKLTEAGIHKITIPNHDPVAKGTLNDILTKIAIWNQIGKEKLIQMLKEY